MIGQLLCRMGLHKVGDVVPPYVGQFTKAVFIVCARCGRKGAIISRFPRVIVWQPKGRD